MNETECEYDEVIDEENNRRGDTSKLHWTHRPLARQVLVSSCIWTTYFQMGLFMGCCPVLVAQLRREASASGIHTIDTEAASWISSTGSFTAIPCVLWLSLMAEYLGRKLSYLVICISTLASFIVFYCSTNFSQLLLSLVLQGPLLGGDTNVCLMMASECASPKYRGVFLTIKSASLYWGIWVANAVGTFFHWKNIGIIGIACAVYNTLAITVCPESPYWLASKGRIKQCEDAHRWLRGTEDYAEKELKCLINLETETSGKKLKNQNLYTQLLHYIKKVSAPDFYQPIILCSLLVLMYNFSGKLILAMYALDILKKVTSSESVAYTGMLILDGITVLGMYVGCAVSRYAKRRTLIFSTEFVAIFFLLCLSLYLYLIKLGFINENVYLSISLLLAFCLSISCGPMILISSLISELLPLELRTFAAILICVVGKTIIAVSYKAAPWLFSILEIHVVFFFFAIGSFFCTTLLWKYLPEMKNKTLKEIQSFFKGKNKSHILNESALLSPG